MKRLINLDFDGVLHSYTSGWEGIDIISDGPVIGPDGRSSIDWLRELVEHPDLRVAIFSARSADVFGRTAMIGWLIRHGLEEALVERIEFPRAKGSAFLTIDDRALRFEGRFFAPDEILGFRTWQQK